MTASGQTFYRCCRMNRVRVSGLLAAACWIVTVGIRDRVFFIGNELIGGSLFRPSGQFRYWAR